MTDPFECQDARKLGFDPDRLARIGSFLQQGYVENGQLPMTQLVVARDGQPVYYNQQGRMGEGREELRDDAIFRLASMTKPVTSIAFMQLVEQCKVALEEPVTKVLPEFADLKLYAGGGGSIPFAPGTPAPPMRFVDLLTHMSGLTYGLQNRTSVDAAYRDHDLDSIGSSHDSDEFIRILAGLPLEAAPGQGWNYSVATDVLGVCVERISGMRLGEYFEQNIFAPLGIVDTAFSVAEGQGERLVDAYRYIPGKPAQKGEDGPGSKWTRRRQFDSGGIGLCGTIADYHRFVTMLLQGGELDGARIVSPKTLRQMRTNHLPGGADLTEMSRGLVLESNSAGTGFGLGFSMVIDLAKTLIPASLGEYYWGGAYSSLLRRPGRSDHLCLHEPGLSLQCLSNPPAIEDTDLCGAERKPSLIRSMPIKQVGSVSPTSPGSDQNETGARTEARQALQHNVRPIPAHGVSPLNVMTD